MIQTAIYRKQHEELERLVGAIADGLDAATPGALSSLLSQLAGVLKVHLAIEDKNFYPRLLAHADPAVRAMAAEYQRTMGDLAPAFDAYYAKWNQSAIEGARMAFATETISIATALRKRIANENDNLYALVDREDIFVS